MAYTAVPAPKLARSGNPVWGEPIQLIGENLTNWCLRHPEMENHWRLEDGVLINPATSTDLVSEQQFENFRLHVEFKYPQGSNSGIYLRGRYKLQIQDDYGKEPSNTRIGGIYGFLTPTVNASKPAEEWQDYDITLIGQRITVDLNGQRIIDDQEIPGITAGACIMDSREGDPGPILLQGDHGPIAFRNVAVTPASYPSE